ncbi:STAS domain-containing protein [Kitasatospora sp. NPDC059648]|uniref:STAS domain-containing protein n=1 Tax=Kitasatospora sp. NPDC059648 TaxID=3346894 RepID=UPI0036B4CB61
MMPDLHDVTVLDSVGLNALLLAQSQAACQGHRRVVQLAPPSDQVARLLEITGCDRVFPVDLGVPRSAR